MLLKLGQWSLRQNSNHKHQLDGEKCAENEDEVKREGPLQQYQNWWQQCMHRVHCTSKDTDLTSQHQYCRGKKQEKQKELGRTLAPKANILIVQNIQLYDKKKVRCLQCQQKIIGPN